MMSNRAAHAKGRGSWTTTIKRLDQKCLLSRFRQMPRLRLFLSLFLRDMSCLLLVLLWNSQDDQHFHLRPRSHDITTRLETTNWSWYPGALLYLGLTSCGKLASIPRLACACMRTSSSFTYLIRPTDYLTDFHHDAIFPNLGIWPTAPLLTPESRSSAQRKRLLHTLKSHCALTLEICWTLYGPHRGMEQCYLSLGTSMRGSGLNVREENCELMFGWLSGCCLWYCPIMCHCCVVMPSLS
jgi:hypothetical protein